MDDYTGLKSQIAQMGLTKPDAYNPYAAGSKLYGPEGRGFPTSGPIGPAGMAGYKKRDAKVQAQKQAINQRIKAAQSGQYMTPDYLKGSI